MLKIWLSPYVLDYISFPSKKRYGVLIRVTDEQGVSGYSDLSPWPELGDPGWQSLLEMSSVSHPLLLAAFYNAREFYQKRNLLEHWLIQKKPHMLHHALLIHHSEQDRLLEYRKKGFLFFKLKIGYDLKSEVEFLNKSSILYPEIQWRLDGNTRLDFKSWQYFWDRLQPDTRKRIEYVEDPFAFDMKQWIDCNQYIPLALDFALDVNDPQFAEAVKNDAFKIYVLKPSRQRWNEVKEFLGDSIKIAVTSQLGHLVDSVWSGWMQSKLLELYPHRVEPVSGTLNHLVLKSSWGGSFEEITSLTDLDQMMDCLNWVEWTPKKELYT